MNLLTLDEIWAVEERMDGHQRLAYLEALATVEQSSDAIPARLPEQFFWHATAEQKTRALEICRDARWKQISREQLQDSIVMNGLLIWMNRKQVSVPTDDDGRMTLIDRWFHEIDTDEERGR